MPDLKLKPCPFCGGEAEEVVVCFGDDERKVQCKKCHIRTDDDYHDNSANKWNNRAKVEAVHSTSTNIQRVSYSHVPDDGHAHRRGGMFRCELCGCGLN